MGKTLAVVKRTAGCIQEFPTTSCRFDRTDAVSMVWNSIAASFLF
jgi:hypothetical protein